MNSGVLRLYVKNQSIREQEVRERRVGHIVTTLKRPWILICFWKVCVWKTCTCTWHQTATASTLTLFARPQGLVSSCRLVPSSIELCCETPLRGKLWKQAKGLVVQRLYSIDNLSRTLQLCQWLRTEESSSRSSFATWRHIWRVSVWGHSLIPHQAWLL